MCPFDQLRSLTDSAAGGKPGARFSEQNWTDVPASRRYGYERTEI